MSDKKMTEGLNPDDHAILLALAQVMAGGIEVPLPATADRARVRDYVELLGLLPYGLVPVTPSPEVKARVLAQVGASPTRTVDEVTLDGSMATDPFDMTFRRPAEPPPVLAIEPANVETDPLWQELDPLWQEAETPEAPTTEAVSSEPVSEEPAVVELLTESTGLESATVELESDPTSQEPATVEPPVSPEPDALEPLSNVVSMPQAPGRATSWWIPALAAMLAFCIVGLAFLAGKLNQQNATIARLNSELQGLPLEDLSSFYDEFTHMKRRFHMVTAVARHAYPMKSVQPLGPNVQTDGVVYVCGNHQRWYLNIQGLESPPQGEEYNLWFVTDQGMVDGGVIEVRPDASSEMEDQTLPAGTHGFAITREQAGIPHDEPTGMMVLLAEESVSL